MEFQMKNLLALLALLTAVAFTACDDCGATDGGTEETTDTCSDGGVTTTGGSTPTADMDVEDIVKINQSLLRHEDLDSYRKIRNAYLGDARPASMLSFISELVTSGMLIELEIVAAK